MLSFVVYASIWLNPRIQVLMGCPAGHQDGYHLMCLDKTFHQHPNLDIWDKVLNLLGWDCPSFFMKQDVPLS